MVRIGLCLLVLAGLGVPLAGANAGEKEIAEELFFVMGIEKRFWVSIDTMVDSQINENPQLTPMKDDLRAFFERYMSYEALKDDLIKKVTEEFSETELQATLDFYSTKAGEKAMRLPALLGSGAEMGALAVQEHKGELEAILAQRVRELREEAERQEAE